MSKHPSTTEALHNQPVMSVGELSLALKRHVEQGFSIVRVRGELSGFKRAASGHLYFSLKDETAVLDAVCWRNAAARLAVNPEDGLDVIAVGRLTTYPDRSKYQLIVESIELAGEGALLKLLEERRRRLAAEGLFDAARKQPIPFLPDVIGVVTSPTGAVIRDILHRVAARFPRRVLVWPVLVQGTEAAQQVADAIAGFNRLTPGGAVPRPDVLIVARGGGSLEDLWAFNEEIVVRAAAESAIPLISAIGHETDTTLIDFAADLRAPTPTAAAEMAVPVRVELAATLLASQTRLTHAMTRMIEVRRAALLAAVRGLPRPQQLLNVARQRLDDWSERLTQSLTTGLEQRRRRLAHADSRLVSPAARIAHGRERLAAESRILQSSIRNRLREHTARLRHAAALLESYSFQRVLERGFTLVHDREGDLITRAASLRPGMPLSLQFADGKASVTVDGSRPAVKGAATKRSDSGQGSLL